MDIRITGSVFAGNNQGNDHKKLEGIVSLPDDEAQRLIDLKVAEVVETVETTIQQDKTPTEKIYKTMNCAEQTAKINAETDITVLESYREDTKVSIKSVLEDRIKTLTDSGQDSGDESGESGTGEGQDSGNGSDTGEGQGAGE